MTTPKIFISYRRDESASYAGRIHERLKSLFGADSVFMDFDDLKPGEEFGPAIESAVDSSDVLLVLIGKRWVNYRNAGGQRRIDDPQDFVRMEIAGGLKRKVRVIPVLLNDASMPSEADLPSDLKPLIRHQAIELSDERWDYDLARLLNALRPRRRRRLTTAVAMAGIVMLVAMGLVFYGRRLPAGGEVNGRWTADIKYEFTDTLTEIFVFETSTENVRGTASFLKVPRPILNGKLQANRISFTTRTFEESAGQSREAMHSYEGTVQGDEIRFVVQTDGGFSIHPPIAFVAKRLQAGQ